METSNAPPLAGWFPDPSGQPQLRWWSGSAWTGDVRPHEPVGRSRLFLRDLPWKRWTAGLVPIAVASVICFGKSEAKGTVRPEIWFWTGFLVVALATVAASAFTLKDRSWSAVLVLAAIVAGIVALAIFVTAAPSASVSCNSASDCDTSYGLGLPILAALLMIPAFLAAAIGKLVAMATRRGA